MPGARDASARRRSGAGKRDPASAVLGRPSDFAGARALAPLMGVHNLRLVPAKLEVSLLGTSPPMQALLASIERAAHSTSSVLLSGETGTGKDLAARSIHQLGPRSDGPFEIVDCGALSPTLIASELFGHERGS